MELRREQLRPSLAALRALTDVPPPREIDEALASGVIWLRWKITTDDVPLLAVDDQDDPLDQVALEALELLSMLARVDYAEWLSVLVEIWPTAASRWINAFYPRQFELGVSVHVSKGGELSKWAHQADRALLGLTDDGSVVWTALHSRLVEEDAATEIRVRFELTTKEPIDIERLHHLLETSQIASIQIARRALTAATQSLKPIFWLVEVQLGLAPHHFIPQFLYYVSEITACDVRVSKIDLACMDYDDVKVEKDTVASLNRILVDSTMHGHVPVESVHVEFGASPGTLDRAFSSILYSNTV